MKKRGENQHGFTLIELLVTIAIVAVLVTLFFPAFRHFREKAETAKCVSHMRTIHAGLGSHLVDKGYWPQFPLGEGVEEDDYFTFWILSLEPYGVAEEAWMCPADKLGHDRDPEEKTGSYIPTAFDSFAITPHRWNQPWLVERGDLHGQGAHIAMPDGSINPSRKAYGGTR